MGKVKLQVQKKARPYEKSKKDAKATPMFEVPLYFILFSMNMVNITFI